MPLSKEWTMTRCSFHSEDSKRSLQMSASREEQCARTRDLPTIVKQQKAVGSKEARLYSWNKARTKSIFTGRCLSATFLTDLDASIASVESASDAQDQAQREESAATAAITQAEQQLMDAVRELSSVVRIIFLTDSAKLTSW